MTVFMFLFFSTYWKCRCKAWPDKDRMLDLACVSFALNRNKLCRLSNVMINFSYNWKFCIFVFLWNQFHIFVEEGEGGLLPHHKFSY